MFQIIVYFCMRISIVSSLKLIQRGACLTRCCTPEIKLWMSKQHFFGRSSRSFNTIFDVASKKVTNDEFVTASCYLWVKEFVYGFGMCPFAASVLKEDSLNISIVRYDVTSSSYIENICSKIIQEAIMLKENDNVRTSLVAIPQLVDFLDLLAVSQIVEEHLEEIEMDKDIQIATFHPNYQFEGTHSQNIENWTNKSPYPMIHLLRVEDVAKALETYPGDPDDIWKNNIKKLETLGEEGIRRVMKNILNSANDMIERS